MNKKYLISVIGATAIGKTDLAIRLAEHFETEILSCDSRQFFKEMRIGTAVPTDEELKRVKHHFIQDRSIFDEYNVGAFERDALQLLEEKFETRDVMIMVGGSGLYVNAVLNGLDDFPDVDPVVRRELVAELKEGGIKPLQKKLESLDPVAFDRIDIQNSQRLVRALEICQATGTPFSSYWMNKPKHRAFESFRIGLPAESGVRSVQQAGGPHDGRRTSRGSEESLSAPGGQRASNGGLQGAFCLLRRRAVFGRGRR